MDPLVPGGNPWASYMLDVYKGGVGPQPLGTVLFEEIEQMAREKLKDCPASFNYAYGNAGTRSTYNANLDAFNKWAIVPRMLVNANKRSLNTTLFGVTYPSPLLLAPVGVQSIFAEGAEFNPARAGRALDVPFILSNAASRNIEEVAEANGGGTRWFQLYWPKGNDITQSILNRVKKSGYSALVLTVDTMCLGWKPLDISQSFMPFSHAVGAQIGLSDPVFMAQYNKQPKTGPEAQPRFPYIPAENKRRLEEGDENMRENVFLGMEWLRQGNAGYFRDWDDLQWLRGHWEGPLILKGIQSPHDAEKAIDCGVDGIVVSNHGGRQVDGAISSLAALELIMKSQKVREAQSSGKFTILFDSGIRTGSHIFKAVALGAQAVLLGRPWVYASAVAGQEGVEQVIRHTLGELDSTMSLSGYTSLDQIRGKADKVLVRVS